MTNTTPAELVHGLELAGTTRARLPFGVRASFDLFTGALLEVRGTLPDVIERAGPVIAAIEKNAVVRQCVRRLSLVDEFEDDEPCKDHWFLLDRVDARLQIEEHFPSLYVPIDDPDIDDVVGYVESDMYTESAVNSSQLREAFDRLFRKLNQQVRTPVPAYGDLRQRFDYGAGGPSSPAPQLCHLMAGAALAAALKGQPAQARSGGGVLRVAIPMFDAASWAERVVLYLIDPDNDVEPVLAIAAGRLSDTGDQLEVSFPVATERNWATLEMVMASATGSATGTLNNVGRTRLAGEVTGRLAIRLAHKGKIELGRSRIDAMLDTLTGPAFKDVREYLITLRESLDRVAPSGLLADCSD